MGLPGEGVEHAPDGNAGEDAVVTPEAHIDHLKGRGHCQGCGIRCGVSSWFWVTAQRHHVAGAGTRVASFQPFPLTPAIATHQRSLYRWCLVSGNQQWEESSGFQAGFQRFDAELWLLPWLGGGQGHGTLALSLAREATFLARKISIENILLQIVEKKHECAYIDIWRWRSDTAKWVRCEQSMKLGKGLWVPLELLLFLISLTFFPDNFFLKFCF